MSWSILNNQNCRSAFSCQIPQNKFLKNLRHLTADSLRWVLRLIYCDENFLRKTMELGRTYLNLFSHAFIAVVSSYFFSIFGKKKSLVLVVALTKYILSYIWVAKNGKPKHCSLVSYFILSLNWLLMQRTYLWED